MDISYPKYYERFACIASSCPDSCCKEWAVDVDAEAAAFYRSLQGDLGECLRRVLTDSDNGAVMELVNGRCPMWRTDGLCRIQAELGLDALCRTCRDFPRLRHDYGSFSELGLELSCPEAARLILSEAEQNWVTTAVPGEEDAEYDGEAMAVLRRTRGEFLAFLDGTPLPFPDILNSFLLYVHAVQEELDGGEEAVLPQVQHFAAHGDIRALQDFFLELEILTEQWKMRLEAPAVAPQWQPAHNRLLRYFVQRYWLQAVSDYDILCRGKFTVAACLLIGYLGGDLAETAQLFSKEIENDPDNMEAIFDGAYTSPALTDANLLGLM